MFDPAGSNISATRCLARLRLLGTFTWHVYGPEMATLEGVLGSACVVLSLVWEREIPIR